MYKFPYSSPIVHNGVTYTTDLEKCIILGRHSNAKFNEPQPEDARAHSAQAPPSSSPAISTLPSQRSAVNLQGEPGYSGAEGGNIKRPAAGGEQMDDGWLPLLGATMRPGRLRRAFWRFPHLFAFWLGAKEGCWTGQLCHRGLS